MITRTGAIEPDDEETYDDRDDLKGVEEHAGSEEDDDDDEGVDKEEDKDDDNGNSDSGKESVPSSAQYLAQCSKQIKVKAERGLAKSTTNSSSDSGDFSDPGINSAVRALKRSKTPSDTRVGQKGRPLSVASGKDVMPEERFGE